MSEPQETGTYRTPECGEDHSEKDLPLGWIADRVEVPENWEAEFVERGHTLRFRRRVDREKYGLKPPGYPGVGISSGRDYWSILGDSDHVIADVWHDPDDDPEDVVESVEDAISDVREDLERVRLSYLLDGCVPESVVENLIDRFGSAERVLEIQSDTPVLESTKGVGPARREKIQLQLWIETATDEPEIRTDGSGEPQETGTEHEDIRDCDLPTETYANPPEGGIVECPGCGRKWRYDGGWFTPLEDETNRDVDTDSDHS